MQSLPTRLRSGLVDATILKSVYGYCYAYLDGAARVSVAGHGRHLPRLSSVKNEFITQNAQRIHLIPTAHEGCYSHKPFSSSCTSLTDDESLVCRKFALFVHDGPFEWW
jgi:hypothetical protein